MRDMDQYADIQSWRGENVIHPVRVIAYTDDGTLIEADDIWQALGLKEAPEYSEDAVAELTHDLKSKFKFLGGGRVRVETVIGRRGHHVTLHFKTVNVGRDLPKSGVERVYFTWEYTVKKTLPEDHMVVFENITDMLDSAYPDEFEWIYAEYQGKHRHLPITVFARGACMGITKVHVDEPNRPQQVFRGVPKRLIDMVLQAKTHIDSREKGDYVEE